MNLSQRILLIQIMLSPLATTLWGGEGADVLLAEWGVRSSLVVHLDCGDGTFTVELGMQPGTKVVQGLSRSPVSVEKARRCISEKGMYGRVSAEVLIGERLPYPDNTVNTLVVQDIVGLEQSGVPLTELFLVVAHLACCGLRVRMKNLLRKNCYQFLLKR